MSASIKRHQKVLVGLGAILLAVTLGAGGAGEGARNPRVIPLPELEAAVYVRADHGRVYVQDKTDIAAYSFETGRFLRRIGRKGQGPGEFTMLGGFTVLADRVVAVDIAKTLFFSIEGEYLSQMSPPARIMFYPFVPVGKHYVGVPRELKDDGTTLPPVGINLFVSSIRFERPVLDLYYASIPFILILLLTLGIITYWPWLSLALL
jgi:hypothetical protein